MMDREQYPHTGRRPQRVFRYSARSEERYLADEFPDSYPNYRRSTKMLIPFIF